MADGGLAGIPPARSRTAEAVQSLGVLGGRVYTRLLVNARRLATIAILAITLGGPIVEMFDSWDQTLSDGNDTETNVVVAALCVGAAFAIARFVVARICGTRSTAITVAPAVSRLTFGLPSPTVPAPRSRSSTPLRV